MSERDFERELRGLLFDILRANRDREPEMQDEIAPAVQRLETIVATMLPLIQDIIAAGVAALNTDETT